MYYTCIDYIIELNKLVIHFKNYFNNSYIFTKYKFSKYEFIEC